MVRKWMGIACLSLLFGALNVSAEIKAEGGYKGGIGIATLNGAGIDLMGWTVSTKTSPMGFCFADISLNDYLGFEVGLGYVAKGSKTSFPIVDSMTNLLFQGDANIAYLSFPVLVKASYPLSFVKPYVFFGPSFDVLGEAKLKGHVTGTFDTLGGSLGDSLVTVPVDGEARTLMNGQFNGIDMAGMLGGGFEIPAWKGSIVLEGCFSFSLKTIFDISEIKVNNSLVGFMAGYKFRFK
jgi:hypothetical protein